MTLEADVQKRVDAWMQEPYDEATRQEVRSLVDAGDEKELYDRFYTDLEFGTGGLRGVMGAGTNRMNKYTVGRATQGLANYIRKTLGYDAEVSVAIAHDSRLKSDEFSRDAAEVLAANGIKTYVFDALRPTPELSFAVRYLSATAGIVVTASHNPKEYNGYKVYWSDGAQIVPPHDTGIIDEVKTIADYSEVKQTPYQDALRQGLIEAIGVEVDEAYYKAILPLSIQPDVCKSEGEKLNIVFTPLHGTGVMLVPEALNRWGFQNVKVCEAQSQPDGNFPNAPSPNPEEPQALEAAIQTAKETGGDLVLATDPDADRVGVAVRDGDEFRLLSGNQLASMLVDYVLSMRKNRGSLPPDARVVTTIVTTELITDISKKYGVPVDITLTGFKWIGEKIHQYEEAGKGKYMVGGEESYGYLIGTHARDKDAVVSSCFIAEMLADSVSKGESLPDRLNRLFKEFGIYEESQISIKFPGAEGKGKMTGIMADLRKNPPEAFVGDKVIEVTDILEDEIRELPDGKVIGQTGLPKSNVLVFRMESGSRVMARPSGTEPKIKFYFSICDKKKLPIAKDDELDKRKSALSDFHAKVREELQKMVEA
ncbi:MAG: phospho-sugar mutase [Candidatus Sumerlaeia bacterium]